MNWVVVPWASIHMKVRMSIECCGAHLVYLFMLCLYLSLICHLHVMSRTQHVQKSIISLPMQQYIDRFTQHRYKADQAFELSSDKSPVAAYLDIDTIVKLCVQNGVQAVHPGYGFLR